MLSFSKKIKKLIFLFVFVSVLASPFFPLQAQESGSELWGGEGLKQEFGEITGLAENDPRVIIANIIKIFLGFLGIIALLLIIYAGFLWMTAGGDESRIEQAKAILKNAFVGIIIILSSYAIVSFILSRLAGGKKLRQSSGPPTNPLAWLSAIGDGIIESHYPARNQQEIPRNTKIIISFREEMDLDSIILGKQEGGNCGEGVICGTLQYENVRIYPTNTDDSCEFQTDHYVNCEANNITNVFVATSDKKNFIFKPNRYLGNTETAQWHTVYLSSGLKKADGESAFGNAGNYEWKFEVSNLLDLTPPKIISIFPFPDNLEDIENNSNAAPGKWEITINANPSGGQDADVVSVIRTDESSNEINAEPVEAPGYQGELDGAFHVIINDGAVSASVYFNNETSVNKTINDGIIDLGYGLNFKILSGEILAGNSWNVNVQAKKDADYLTIETVRYIFGSDITLGASKEATANNIAAFINAKESMPATAAVEGNVVTLTAKESGKTILVNSSSTGINIENTLAPVERNFSIDIRGLEDLPINAVIQINFDEPIDPLSVSNFAAVLKIEGLNATPVQGQFLFSNQYKTIEFRPDTVCGANGGKNACGETIYCLPAKSNLKILINPGLLSTCSNDQDCPDGSYPCNTNVKLCQLNNINYPLAQFNTGIVDMCDNSLDGNKNNNAQGPKSQSNLDPYTENYPNLIGGDDYQWSFWTAKEPKLSAPVILERAPAQNSEGIELRSPLTAIFNDLMMSSSLRTGSIIIENVVHNAIRLEANTSNPVGYWVEKEDLDRAVVDGYQDQTKVIIKHDDFEQENVYSGDIGSGVKDIYQNCYNPSLGPCADNDPLKKCSCSGTTCVEEGSN